MAPRIHPSAHVGASASIADGVSIWQNAQVRDGAVLGARSIVGMGTYIDEGVVVGADCKFQNYVCTYRGLTLQDGVFCGPCVVFTNDMYPRAIAANGALKGIDDWTCTPTLVKYGASLGANCTIRCGVTIGRWAMVGAGSVVTRDVPDYALVVGNPARVIGYVNEKGERVASAPKTAPTTEKGES